MDNNGDNEVPGPSNANAQEEEEVETSSASSLIEDMVQQLARVQAAKKILVDRNTSLQSRSNELLKLSVKSNLEVISLKDEVESLRSVCEHVEQINWKYGEMIFKISDAMEGRSRTSTEREAQAKASTAEEMIHTLQCIYEYIISLGHNPPTRPPFPASYGGSLPNIIPPAHQASSSLAVINSNLSGFGMVSQHSQQQQQQQQQLQRYFLEYTQGQYMNPAASGSSATVNAGYYGYGFQGGSYNSYNHLYQQSGVGQQPATGQNGNFRSAYLPYNNGLPNPNAVNRVAASAAAGSASSLAHSQAGRNAGVNPMQPQAGQQARMRQENVRTGGAGAAAGQRRTIQEIWHPNKWVRLGDNERFLAHSYIFPQPLMIVHNPNSQDYQTPRRVQEVEVAAVEAAPRQEQANVENDPDEGDANGEDNN